MSPLSAALVAGGLAAGLLLSTAGLIGVRRPAGPASRLAEAARRAAGLRLPPAARRRRHLCAVAATAAAGLTWMHTGVPIAGLVAAAMVASLPWLFGGARAESGAIARLDAIEVWTRRLADLVRSGSSLHQAIVTSAADPPAAIAEELTALAGDLRGQAPTAQALRAFADRLHDPSADEVIAALILNTRTRGQRLAEVLAGIAEGMAELIGMRREVAASRADARISGYILAGLALGGMCLLLANTSYMAPFRSGHGQAVLGGCAGLAGACLAWARWLNMPPRVPRLLAPPARNGPNPAAARPGGQPAEVSR